MVIEGVASQLRFFVDGAAGDQVGPLTARGVIQVPVHQLAHPRHLRTLHQRGVHTGRGFIDFEGVLFPKPLCSSHRIKPALLHQAAEDRFGFIIATAFQQ
ncbi:hypothetical protein D3C75_1193390 [compost metagenome]